MSRNENAPGATSSSEDESELDYTGTPNLSLDYDSDLDFSSDIDEGDVREEGNSGDISVYDSFSDDSMGGDGKDSDKDENAQNYMFSNRSPRESDDEELIDYYSGDNSSQKSPMFRRIRKFTKDKEGLNKYENVIDLSYAFLPCNIWCVQSCYINMPKQLTGILKGQDARYSSKWFENWPEPTDNVERNKELDRRLLILNNSEPFADTLFLKRKNHASVDITKDAMFKHDHFWKCREIKAQICYLSRKGTFFVVSFSDNELNQNHPAYDAHKFKPDKMVDYYPNSKSYNFTGPKSEKTVHDLFEVKPTFEVQVVVYVKDIIDMKRRGKNATIRLSGYHDMGLVKTVTKDGNNAKYDGFTHFDELMTTHYYRKLRRNSNGISQAKLSYSIENDSYTISYATDYSEETNPRNLIEYNISSENLNQCLTLMKTMDIDRRKLVHPGHLSYFQRQFSLSRVNPMCLSQKTLEMEADDSFQNVIPKHHTQDKLELSMKLRSESRNIFVNMRIKTLMEKLRLLHERENKAIILTNNFFYAIKPNFKIYSSVGHVPSVIPDGFDLLDIMTEDYSKQNAFNLGLMNYDLFQRERTKCVFLGLGSKVSHPLIPEDLPEKDLMVFYLLRSDRGIENETIWDYHPDSAFYKSFKGGTPYVYNVNKYHNDNVNSVESMHMVCGFKYTDLLKQLLKKIKDRNTIPVTMFGMFTYHRMFSMPRKNHSIPANPYELHKVTADDDIITIIQETQVFSKFGELLDVNISVWQNDASEYYIKLQLFDYDFMQDLNFKSAHKLKLNIKYSNFLDMLDTTNELYDLVEKEKKRIRKLHKTSQW